MRLLWADALVKQIIVAATTAHKSRHFKRIYSLQETRGRGQIGRSCLRDTINQLDGSAVTPVTKPFSAL
jgi:hypothetical protein